MKKLILLRHGQSEWNKENRFTGWKDVSLSALGVEEAKKAGITLKENGCKPQIAYVSYLKRAIKTLWLALEEMDQMHLPVYKTWRLNEKHYGALEGLNKTETVAKYGEEQVKLWRRGFAVQSPALETADPRNPANQDKYAGIEPGLLPLTESLADTIQRILPYWHETIAPSFAQYNEVLITAHGNSLRGIIMYLKKMSETEILELNIPTGIPYVLELNDDLTYNKDYYLADKATLQQLMADVANQGKAK